MFQSIYTTVISNIEKSLGKGSGWIIDSVIDHNISIPKYNPLTGSSSVKLPEELDHPREGLINIQNTDDNECFKWFLVRCLNPANHNPRRITKADKDFVKRLDLKYIKFPVKIRDFHRNGKKNSIRINVFGYENKAKHPIHVSKKMLQRKTRCLIIDGRRRKNNIFLSMISIDSCMIIHYITQENIFVVIDYMLSLQKKH